MCNFPIIDKIRLTKFEKFFLVTLSLTFLFLLTLLMLILGAGEEKGKYVIRKRPLQEPGAPTTTEDPPLTMEEKLRQIYAMMGSSLDGSVSIEEVKTYMLYRVRIYTFVSSSRSWMEKLLDDFKFGLRPTTATPENSLIHNDKFLAPLDVDGDGSLTNDELTEETVAILLRKVFDIFNSYDLDHNGLISWDEFYIVSNK